MKKTFCKEPKEVRLRVFQVGDRGACPEMVLVWMLEKSRGPVWLNQRDAE